MKWCRRLFEKTTEGTLLISEISEILRLGKTDHDNLVIQLSLQLFDVIQALVRNEVTGCDGLEHVKDICQKLKRKAKQSCVYDAERIQGLINKIERFIIRDFLQANQNYFSEKV